MKGAAKLVTVLLGGGFSPSDISGLIWWLDANTGTYQDAGTTPATAEGDAVGQWNDQSVTGNNASQAADKRPTINIVSPGKKTIRFDGGDDIMGASRVLSDDLFSIFAVARLNTVSSHSANDTLLAQHSNTLAVGRTFFIATPASAPLTPARLFFSMGGASQNVLTTTAVWDQSFHIIYAQSNGSGTTHMRVDGGAAEGTLTGQVFIPENTSMSIGGYGFGGTEAGQMPVDVSEILIYNRVLADAERFRVETYLRRRWL